MDLDSSLLRAFVAVADKLHFGHAAHELFISQQALSKRIARLESILGIQLLARDRRSVALTMAGQRLLPEARKAIDAIDAAAAVARPVLASMTIDVLDEHLAMLPRIRSINTTDPQLELSAVMRHDASDAVSRLRDGEADIVLGRPGAVEIPWPQDIHGRPVLAEPILLLIPAGHELESAEHITPTALAGRRLWFPNTGAPTEWIDLLDDFVSAFDLNIDQTGSTFGFAYWLEQVAHGTAPPSFIGAGMQLPPNLPISSIPIINPTPVFWWWAMWRRRLPPNLVTQFRATLSTAISDIEPGNSANMWMPEQDRQFLT